MNAEFYIVEIYGKYDGHNGDIVVVKANPVTTNALGTKYFNKNEDYTTESFFLPKDDSIIAHIRRLKESQLLWTPNSSDFEDEVIIDEDTYNLVTTHRHISLLKLINFEFIILEIRRASDSNYGDVVVVKANPVKYNHFGIKTVAEHLYDKTQSFFFPDNDRIIAPIRRVMYSKLIWTPNPDDFVDQFIFEDDSVSAIPIHRHISFWNDTYDSSINQGKPTAIVPNAKFKAKQLKQQYTGEGWMYTYNNFCEYVESLAYGDDIENFWSWLFDNPRLNGYTHNNLPGAYLVAYEDFLERYCE